MAFTVSKGALVFAALCGAFVSSVHARSLQAVSEFPYRKCLADGSGSPYVLSANDPILQDGNLYVNFTVISNPGANTLSDCYGALVDHVFKLVIESTQTCKKKVSVYVNEELKRGSVYWDDEKNGVSLLRITKLNLGTGSLGARITLVATAPCTTLAALTGGKDVLLNYLTPAPSHKCCPVNPVNWIHRNGQGEASGEVSGEISGEESRNGQGEQSSVEESSSA